MAWAWVGGLLSFLAGFKKLFLWLAAIVPFLVRIVGWVQRVWQSGRNTLLGRLLRMAGFLSVSALVTVSVANGVFQIVRTLLDNVTSGQFSWPTHPLIHGIIGAVNTVIPLSMMLSLLLVWVYISLFTLCIRLGRWIVSLTSG